MLRDTYRVCFDILSCNSSWMIDLFWGTCLSATTTTASVKSDAVFVNGFDLWMLSIFCLNGNLILALEKIQILIRKILNGLERSSLNGWQVQPASKYWINLKGCSGFRASVDTALRDFEISKSLFVLYSNIWKPLANRCKGVFCDIGSTMRP